MKRCSDHNNQIICADVFEGLSCVLDNSVDLIFIDPPYNIGKKFDSSIDKWSSDDKYLTWCYKWIDECINKLKSSGSLYIMTSTQFMPYFDIYIRKKLTILSRIVWNYDSSGVQAKKYYGSMYEPILFCVNRQYGIVAIVDRYMSAIDEIINIPKLTEYLNKIYAIGLLDNVFDEIIVMSKLEFNYEND